MFRAAKNSCNTWVHMLKEHYIISKNMHFLVLWVIENSVKNIKESTSIIHKICCSRSKTLLFFFINRKEEFWENLRAGSECTRNMVISQDFKPQKLAIAGSSMQGLSGSPMKHKNTNKNPDVRKCDASMIMFIKLHFSKTNPAALEYGLHHFKAQVLHFVSHPIQPTSQP